MVGGTVKKPYYVLLVDAVNTYLMEQGARLNEPDLVILFANHTDQARDLYNDYLGQLNLIIVSAKTPGDPFAFVMDVRANGFTKEIMTVGEDDVERRDLLVAGCSDEIVHKSFIGEYILMRFLTSNF